MNATNLTFDDYETTSVPLSDGFSFARDAIVTYPDMRADSAIIRVSASKRIGRIATIHTISSETEGQITPAPFAISSGIAGFLAMREFNNRSGTILPGLPQLIGDCDLELDMFMYDAERSPIVAARRLLHAFDVVHSVETPFPMAIVGAARSAISEPLAILTGTYATPQISPASTSAELDNPDIFSYFGRTIPPNTKDAKVLVEYFDSLRVKHFGVIYVRDQYGIEFSRDVQAYAASADPPLEVAIFAYDPSNEESIKTAVDRLAATHYNFFFGIVNSNTMITVMREAQRAGIAGTPKHAWYLSDAAISVTSAGFSVKDQEVYDAIDGIGILILNLAPHPAFTQAMTNFQSDAALQDEFIQRQYEPDFFTSTFNLTTHQTTAGISQQLFFDAVISLGLAACNVDDGNTDFFNGPELFAEWLMSNFVGVSGQVEFNSVTGSRDGPGVTYGIFNVVADPEASAPENFRFKSTLSISAELMFIEPRTFPVDPPGDGERCILYARPPMVNFQIISPFIYADGTVDTPERLPPLDENMNLIPPGVITVGLLLAAFVMLSSVWWSYFTWKYKNRPTVRVAQPFFLQMTVIGTFIMGSAIVPDAMQYPISQAGLNFSCMASVWLFSVGFVTR
jgi:ABC-type branched-subunit amino acid transport system substrate-binding protein